MRVFQILRDGQEVYRLIAGGDDGAIQTALKLIAVAPDQQLTATELPEFPIEQLPNYLEAHAMGFQDSVEGLARNPFTSGSIGAIGFAAGQLAGSTAASSGTSFVIDDPAAEGFADDWPGSSLDFDIGVDAAREAAPMPPLTEPNHRA